MSEPPTRPGATPAPSSHASPEPGRRTAMLHGSAERASVPGLAAELAFPAVLLILGAGVLVQALMIATPVSSNGMGPDVYPTGIGLLLLAVGGWLVVIVLRGERGEEEGSEDVDDAVATDWRTVAGLAGSFAALVVLIEPLGWPIAATVLFGGAAWFLGARPWWRPLLVGAVLALVVQVAFTQLLGLFLPAGPLEGVSFLG